MGAGGGWPEVSEDGRRLFPGKDSRVAACPGMGPRRVCRSQVDVLRLPRSNIPLIKFTTCVDTLARDFLSGSPIILYIQTMVQEKQKFLLTDIPAFTHEKESSMVYKKFRRGDSARDVKRGEVFPVIVSTRCGSFLKIFKFLKKIRGGRNGTMGNLLGEC